VDAAKVVAVPAFWSATGMIGAPTTASISTGGAPSAPATGSIGCPTVAVVSTGAALAPFTGPADADVPFVAPTTAAVAVAPVNAAGMDGEATGG
jgi:hypothetical protein